MSSSLRIDKDYSVEIDELFQIGTRCRELRKEKDMLKESQSQSFELVKSLELNVQKLTEGRSEDRKHIAELERELRNCSEEIDYLQDLLNLRNREVKSLGEHVHALEVKLANMENFQATVSKLREELRRAHTDRLFLIQDLERKEIELQRSMLYIEKLEESIACVALESQCEIESIKLDFMTLERNGFEVKKFQEEAVREKTRMNKLIEELETRVQDAQKIIEHLSEENKELQDRLEIEEEVKKLMENKDMAKVDTRFSINEAQNKFSVSKGRRNSSKSLGVPSTNLAVVTMTDDLKDKTEKISHEIHDYQLLVKQLKEELREEKLKAKEEAEDLIQEIAELRYHLTGLLDQECQRRACVEHASLQRIAELEAQIQKDQLK